MGGRLAKPPLPPPLAPTLPPGLTGFDGVAGGLTSSAAEAEEPGGGGSQMARFCLEPVPYCGVAEHAKGGGGAGELQLASRRCGLPHTPPTDGDGDAGPAVPGKTTEAAIGSSGNSCESSAVNAAASSELPLIVLHGSSS